MTKNEVYFKTASANDEGQRLDNFLLKELKGVPRTHIYQIIRKGEVRVNKGRSKPLYRLVLGDIVRVPPIHKTAPKVVELTQSLSKLLDKSILYEDEYFVIVNKPAGLAVHGGSGLTLGLIEAMRLKRNDTEAAMTLVHRLDKETSGCVVIAKTRQMAAALGEIWSERQVSKTYKALLQGNLKYKTTADAALQKNVLASGERKVYTCEEGEGQDALTHFIPRKHYTGATFCEVELETGRTHQIRVHATSLGHPIAGDLKYGDRAFNQWMEKRGGNRLFLHAASLRFLHPVHAVTVAVEAPLGSTLEAILNNLG